jgi:hypothetical protein
VSVEQSGGSSDRSGGEPVRAAGAAGALRTDVRRALVLLESGRWVRAHAPAGGRAWAEVQLSRYTGDAIPVGLDVLGLLRGAGYVAEGRRLPGGARRFDLTPAGRAALGAAPDPTGGLATRSRRGTGL